MTKNEFEQEKRRIELRGWRSNGDIACAEVGGDHNAEIWVDPKNELKTAVVCGECGYLHYQ